MSDPIFEVLSDMLDLMGELGETIGPDDLTQFLEQAGFMVVPIEDPTNLRFGVE